MESTVKRDKTFSQPVNWVTTFFMLAFHIGAIVALFFFSWKAVLMAVFLWWVAGSLGIGMGYHRLLTHRGYKTPKWVEYFLTVCATLALEGGPIFWVATHRRHHQNTDKEGDPHSPRDGGLWAHMGWIMTGKAMHNKLDALLPYVPDLRKDKFHVWISEYHWITQVVVGVALLLFRRAAVFAMGLLCPDCLWAALHLARELRDAHVGLAALHHGRRLHQQLLGSHPDVRRRLAQ